jgi:lipopolysaccharide heptosyltransferase I
MRNFKNILIVRLSAAGDVVHAMPAVCALGRVMHGARISWVVEPLSEPLVRALPCVHETIVLDRKALNRGIRSPLTALPTVGKVTGFLSGLRKRKFDLAVDFQGNMRSAFVTAGSGARVRVGFSPGSSTEFTANAYTRHVGAARGSHKVDKDFELVRALGGTGAPERVRLDFSENNGKQVDEFLELVAPNDEGVAVLHPGVSTFGSFKAWPAENYAGLAKRIINDLGLKVCYTWGPGEELAVDQALSMSGEGAFKSPATRDLGELARLISPAAVFVGSDTGPLHLANAVGTPVVGLYGPKDPRIYGPYFEPRAVVVNESCECSPCEKRKCDDVVCMTGISVDAVFEAVGKWLEA